MSTTSQTAPIEEPKSTKQKILEAGASLMQSKDPIKAFKEHLISLSFVAGEPTRQFVLHHFLSAFNDEFAQALLYDGDKPDSKLVGIQYIVSEKVFITLPENEKSLWHSFHYMIKSGLLLAPSLPSLAEKPLMSRLSTSYGKTFMFWDTNRSALPVGIPQLMMSFTNDGQATDNLVRDLFDTAGVKSTDILKRREKVSTEATTTTPIISGADSWEKGETYQLKLERLGKNSELDHHATPASGSSNQNTTSNNRLSGIATVPGAVSESGVSSDRVSTGHQNVEHDRLNTKPIENRTSLPNQVGTSGLGTHEAPIQKSPEMVLSQGKDQSTLNSNSSRGSISPYDTSSPHYQNSEQSTSKQSSSQVTETRDAITTNSSFEDKLNSLKNLDQNGDDIIIERKERVNPTTITQESSTTTYKNSDLKTE